MATNLDLRFKMIDLLSQMQRENANQFTLIVGLKTNYEMNKNHKGEFVVETKWEYSHIF